MKLFRNFRRRFRMFRYRLENYAYYRRKGLPIRRAWTKADLTL